MLKERISSQRFGVVFGAGVSAIPLKTGDLREGLAVALHTRVPWRYPVSIDNDRLYCGAMTSGIGSSVGPGGRRSRREFFSRSRDSIRILNKS